MPTKKKTKQLHKPHRFSRREGIAVAVVFALVGSILAFASFADSGTTLYLSPASQSMSTSANFSVQVRVNNTSSGQYNQVKANLVFPANLLTVDSVTLDTNTFIYGQQSFDNNAGTISINNNSYSSQSQGDVLVATINFTAKAAGTATVSFNDQSSITSSGYRFRNVNFLTGTAGGTYSISNPAPTPAPTPTRSPVAVTSPIPAPSSPATAPSGGGCSADPSLPAVSGVQVSQVAYQTALVSWQNNSGQTVQLSYGTDQAALNPSATIDCTASSPSVNLNNLAAGTHYYFQLSIGGAPEYSGSFRTTGWPVSLNITDSHNKPISTSVSIAGDTQKSDNRGNLLLELAAGTYTLKVGQGSQARNFQLVVKNQSVNADGIAPTQKFGFKLPSNSSSKSALGKVAAVAAGLAAAGLALWIVIKLRKNRPPRPHRRAVKPPKTEAPKPHPVSPPPPPPAPVAPAVPMPTYHTPLSQQPHWTSLPAMVKRPASKKSSIAAGADYQEPEDMFEQGSKRLEQEGYQSPKK